METISIEAVQTPMAEKDGKILRLLTENIQLKLKLAEYEKKAQDKEKETK